MEEEAYNGLLSDSSLESEKEIGRSPFLFTGFSIMTPSKMAKVELRRRVTPEIATTAGSWGLLRPSVAREQCVNPLLECLERIGAGDNFSRYGFFLRIELAHDEAGGSANADGLTIVQFFLGLFLGLAGIQARIEFRGFEPDLLGVILEVVHFHGLHILEDGIVHFPEFPLLARAQVGFRGLLSEGVKRQGKLTIGELNFARLDVFATQLAQCVVVPTTAERSLKVGELDDGDLGVLVPLNVVSDTDRHFAVRLLFIPSSSTGRLHFRDFGGELPHLIFKLLDPVFQIRGGCARARRRGQSEPQHSHS